MPLGLFAGFCGRERSRGAPLEHRARVAPGWAVAAPAIALLLPALVELGQAILPLNRVCAVLDVVDNISGVLIGLAVALAASLVRHGWARSRPRRA